MLINTHSRTTERRGIVNQYSRNFRWNWTTVSYIQTYHQKKLPNEGCYLLKNMWRQALSCISALIDLLNDRTRNNVSTYIVNNYIW